MKKAIFLAALFNSIYAHAEIETDKKSGNCIAYFAAIGKERGMKDALSMADNQKRAIIFADNKINEMKRYKSDKTSLQTLATSANSDCRAIGIRPADY